jgi:hypothetical protein
VGVACSTDQVRGFSIRRGPCTRPSANGETDFETRIVTVREDLEPPQAARTPAHERAHIALCHLDRLHAGECRGRIEVEAESVAFMVCTEAGMDAACYSVPYVAGWANGDPKVITDSAVRVIGAARDIAATLRAVEQRPS